MSSVIDKAIAYAVGIANDDSHGYDQINRWGPDFDCSSLVIESFEQAGVQVKEHGATYTGNMRKAFLACGFVEVPLAKRQRGDVLLNEQHHTALMIDDKRIVQASINEKGTIKGGKTGDQTGMEISVRNYYKYSKGWDVVLRYPEESEKPTEDITKIAKDVIAGKYGNGSARKKALESAGYNYEEVQTKVNELLNVKKPTTTFTMKVNVSEGSLLNVRATPNGRIVGGLGRGEEVTVLSYVKGGWSKIKYNGNECYVFSSYLA